MIKDETEPTAGWTVETLRVYMQRQINDLRNALPAPTQWTVDTVHTHLQIELDNLRIMLNERYATQTKAIDAAFIAQQTAMQTAFTAADRAVQAALDAAKEAVAKAEMSAEKRFESVNEFRGQLSDQVATFAPREFVDAQVTAITMRITDLSESRQAALDEARRLAGDLLPREVFDAHVTAGSSDLEQLRVRCSSIESRLDTAAGMLQGSTTKTTDARAAIAAAIGIATLVLAVVIFVANILTSR